MKAKILPLKHQIVFLISTLGICILIVSLNSMQSYSKLQTTTIKNNQELISNQVLQSAERNYEEIKNIASSIAYNQLVQQYLMETDADMKLTSYQHVINFMNNSKTLNKSILDVAILGESQNAANLSGDISIYSSLYNELPDDNLPIYFLDKTTLTIGDNRYTCQIAAMPIYQLSTTTANFIGVLFIAINPSIILGDNLLANSSIPNELLYVNSNQELILGDEKLFDAIQKSQTEKDSFNIVNNGQTYNCQRFHVKTAEGTLYTLVNQSVYSQKIRLMVLRQSILIIITFIIAVILLLTFFKPITQSLEQLTEIMNKISSGKRTALNERIAIDSRKRYCKEVYSIATSFNEMLNETNRLNHDIFDTYTKMYELEMINRKTEIAFLRSQINPHFLYNTLTLICGMASMNESDGVINIAQALSQIYRFSIKGDDIITVRKELEIAKAYIMIQTTRFEDRFTVEYDFTEEVFDALVPKMVIQPLVENAILHGLEKSLKKGHLTLGGRRNPIDNTLVLWVYDTGVGMSSDSLVHIRKLLEDTSVNRSDNIKSNFEQIDFNNQDSLGLCNVNSRISLYYGKLYSLHIDSEENVGTNIQIKIPFNINTASIE